MIQSLFLLLSLAGLPLEGSLAPRQEPAPEAPEKKPEHLKEWPKLKSLPQARGDLTRLRKARTEEMGVLAHASLLKQGAGVAPLLIAGLGKERSPKAQARMIAVLDLVTDGSHTRLIAPSFENKKRIVRLWSLRRMALFPDKALKAEADKALQAARKLKRGTEQEIKQEQFAAALATAAGGSLTGFDILGELASKHWGEEGGAVRTALEGVRGEEASKLCASGLSGERRAVVQSLRMLAGCGDDSILVTVSGHLASTDNSILVEAINACRGIVDGNLPLPRLSAFQAIELAKEWRARL
jgi:hypothetical protein